MRATKKAPKQAAANRITAPATARPGLAELREQQECLKLEMEIHRLEHAVRLMGFRKPWSNLIGERVEGRPISLGQAAQVIRQAVTESAQVPDWVGSYVDLLDRYRDGQNLLTPITSPNDHRFGRNFPLWQTEQELNLLRAPARVLCATNTYAQGLLSGLQCFVINTGYTYRVVPRKGFEVPKSELDKADSILEEFRERVQWNEWEREFFWISREDGDAILRTFFTDDGITEIRSVWAEQVFQPPGTDAADWSFGILTDREDVQKPLKYWIGYLNAMPDGEEVEAADVIHYKSNVKRAIKRGVTDFAWSAYDAFNIADKLRRNMGEGAAVQAALAGIREHQTANLQGVQGFQQSLVDYTRSDPVTGRSTDYAKMQPGTILDMDPNTIWKAPPMWSGNAEANVAILDALIRGGAARWNAPEWLASSNSQNMGAYTASLVAESPFVIRVKTEQTRYSDCFKRVHRIVLRNAVEAGQLSEETFRRTDIQVEAPSPESRKKLEEAQANQIRVMGGWKSKQTVAQEEGLDWEQEQTNIESANERLGDQGLPLPLPGSGPAPAAKDSGLPSRAQAPEAIQESSGVGVDPSAVANTSGWTTQSGGLAKANKKKPARAKAKGARKAKPKGK